MATKKELLKALTEAGIEGFTMADSRTDLEKAVAKIDPPVTRQKGV